VIILGGTLGGRKSVKSSKSFGMMVARDGIELEPFCGRERGGSPQAKS
jgi:hypothetical protein